MPKVDLSAIRNAPLVPRRPVTPIVPTSKPAPGNPKKEGS
jgi:hypothetical protein